MSWSDVPPGGYRPPEQRSAADGAPSWTAERAPQPPADPGAAGPSWATGGGWTASDPSAPPGTVSGQGATPPLREPAGQPGWGSNAPTAAVAGAPAAGGAFTQSGPPTVWLLIGLLAPVVAAVLFVLAGPVENAVGWALAAFGGIAALAIFQTKDLARRASSWYAANDGMVGPVRVLVLVAAIGVAAGHAYFFADWLSRSDLFA